MGIAGLLAAADGGSGSSEVVVGLVMVAVAGFFAFIVSYLSNWLWRIKGEKGVFSSRLQFDKEFEIYQRLWAALTQLHQTAQAVVAGQGDAAKLAAAQAAAAAAVFESSPFYAEPVFVAARQALATAALVRPGPEGRATAERLERELAQVSQAIRTRVWSGA